MLNVRKQLPWSTALAAGRGTPISSPKTFYVSLYRFFAWARTPNRCYWPSLRVDIGELLKFLVCGYVQ